MITTNIQLDIGKQDNGCIVVALLSASAQQQIITVQEELRARLGDILWTMPRASLHTTLCEIIQPKPYSVDKQLIYEQNYNEYEKSLTQVLEKQGPIEVHFNAVEASQQAIIVRGDDNGIFNKIRAELVGCLPFPTETKRPPDIVHSSIARYTKEVELATVKAAAEGIRIDFNEVITEFQFMYPVWPHLFHYDVVRRYRLGSRS